MAQGVNVLVAMPDGWSFVLEPYREEGQSAPSVFL